MIKGVNYWAFTSKDLNESMRYAKELGYDSFEPTVDDAGPLTFATSDAEVLRIKTMAGEIGIEIKTVASGYAWSRSPTSQDANEREQAASNGKRLIEIASLLGAEVILYIPGIVSASFIPEIVPQAYEVVLDRAHESLAPLVPIAKSAGVRIGIENVWNKFLLDPVSMRDFIDRYDSTVVGSYFDTGNIVLYGHPEDWITTLGERVFAVHIKDFRSDVGTIDGFVDLLAGDVDFVKVKSALDTIGYSGPCTIEYVPGRPGAVEKGIASLKIIESGGLR